MIWKRGDMAIAAQCSIGGDIPIQNDLVEVIDTANSTHLYCHIFTGGLQNIRLYFKSSDLTLILRSET